MRFNYYWEFLCRLRIVNFELNTTGYTVERIKHLEGGGVSSERTCSDKLPLGNEDNCLKQLMKTSDKWNCGSVVETK